jgi:exosortase
MTPAASAARPGRLSPLAILAVPLAATVWAYWPTLVDLARVWQINPQYSHGWLVPVFAAILLWSRRNLLDLSAISPSLWGLPFLIAAGVLRLYGAYYAYAPLDDVSLLPALFGVGLLVGGWAFGRWAWPAVLFLVFMIPLPYFVAIALSAPLQSLATVVSTFIMQVGGLPALSEGTVIRINDQAINIVEACSGLSMLMVFIALSTAMALIVSRPLVDRIILLVSAVPIAVTANILRVTITGILYETTSSAMAHTFFHDVAGWLMMPLALGLLWLELKILDRVFVPQTRSISATPAAVTARRAAAAATRPQRVRQNPPPRERKHTAVKPATEPAQPVETGEAKAK